MNPPTTTRILIVDDHPLLLKGIKVILDQYPEFSVCGEAHDAATALSLIESERPDIVILDLFLNDSSGFDVLKDVEARFPGMKVLVFSGREESAYAPLVLRAGASGFLPKAEAFEKLVIALRKIISGGLYLSEELETQFLKRLVTGERIADSPVELLSDRESEIFTLLGRGFSPRDIAQRLNLSIRTIESHRAHIKEKLNLQTAAELTHCAVQWVENSRSK